MRPALIGVFLAALMAQHCGRAAAGEAPATGSGVADPGQISPAGASSVDTSQISTSRPAATAPAQVGPSTPTAEAPPPLSSVGQGRNADIARVKGRDRCDPAAPKAARSADCAAILDNRAAEFSDGSQNPGAPTVPPDKTATGLVDDVVNGGTGTVVPLPPN